MLGAAELVAFVATSDLGRASVFYAQTLGLPLLEQTPFACVFQAPNAVLRVTVAEKPVAAGYTVLGWHVPSIAQAARELGERGVETLRYESMQQDELGVWRSPSGAQVVWFKDPDGNVLSLTEL